MRPCLDKLDTNRNCSDEYDPSLYLRRHPHTDRPLRRRRSASVRPDDLAAIPLAALKARNPGVDWAHLDDVILGCANQAGEDNRNVARMAALLGGLGDTAPGTTINRLCGSGLDAVAMAARSIKAGEADLVVAGGVESMTRAPFVMPKADSAFSRANAVYDTTIGWRFVNKRMKAEFGIDSMPETAENVAGDYGVSRDDQDRFAHASQQRAAAAIANGRLAAEIVAVTIPQRKGDPILFDTDEHPRLHQPRRAGQVEADRPRGRHRSPPATPRGSMTARRR